jgi:26S proteasome regulatory subunit N12
VCHARGKARWYSPLIEHRNEIASCEETAYESLPLKDAATLLFFQNQSELLRFAEQVTLPDLQLDARWPNCDLQRGWQVNLSESKIYFAKKGEEAQDIPKEKLIIQSLQYARELEQIV